MCCKKDRGIGLTNVRRRLELFYPGRHKLQVDPDHESYRVSLKNSTVMTIHCAIADDEPIALEILQDYIRLVPELRLIGQCKNSAENAVHPSLA